MTSTTPISEPTVEYVLPAEFARHKAGGYIDQNDDAAIAFRHIANCIDAIEAERDALIKERDSLVGACAAKDMAAKGYYDNWRAAEQERDEALEALADLVENKCSPHCDWETARQLISKKEKQGD